MFRHDYLMTDAIRFTRRAQHLRTLELACRQRGFQGEASELAREAAKAEQRAETMLGFLVPRGEGVE